MIFNGARKKLEIFELVNGSRSTKEIARKVARDLHNVDRDIGQIRDMELIKPRQDQKGNDVKKDGFMIYEKVPLVKHVPISYFGEIADTSKLVRKSSSRPARISRPAIHVPTPNEILDICKQGEDQHYEFKAPGTAADKLTKEIAGLLHTKDGGVIFYGVDDSGAIIGTDLRRQDLDQKVQNSVRNTISPAPSIEIREQKVMGSKILLIVVPPWDRKTIYHNSMDGRYYIRRGTNIFAVKPEEIRKLHEGNFVV